MIPAEIGSFGLMISIIKMEPDWIYQNWEFTWNQYAVPIGDESVNQGERDGVSVSGQGFEETSQLLEPQSQALEAPLPSYTPSPLRTLESIHQTHGTNSEDDSGDMVSEASAINSEGSSGDQFSDNSTVQTEEDTDNTTDETEEDTGKSRSSRISNNITKLGSTPIGKTRRKFLGRRNPHQRHLASKTYLFRCCWDLERWVKQGNKSLDCIEQYCHSRFEEKMKKYQGCPSELQALRLALRTVDLYFEGDILGAFELYHQSGKRSVMLKHLEEHMLIRSQPRL